MDSYGVLYDHKDPTDPVGVAYHSAMDNLENTRQTRTAQGQNSAAASDANPANPAAGSNQPDKYEAGMKAEMANSATGTDDRVAQLRQMVFGAESGNNPNVRSTNTNSSDPGHAGGDVGIGQQSLAFQQQYLNPNLKAPTADPDAQSQAFNNFAQDQINKNPAVTPQQMYQAYNTGSQDKPLTPTAQSNLERNAAQSSVALNEPILGPGAPRRFREPLADPLARPSWAPCRAGMRRSQPLAALLTFRQVTQTRGILTNSKTSGVKASPQVTRSPMRPSARQRRATPARSHPQACSRHNRPRTRTSPAAQARQQPAAASAMHRTRGTARKPLLRPADPADPA